MKKRFTLLAFYLATFFVQPVYSQDWPVLKTYDQEHTYKIALPIGGIGTGTVSLGGRGNLQDWEIMNRPAKGYNPGSALVNNSASFILFTEVDGKKDTRLMEGPVPFYLYEGPDGAIASNHGLPRFNEVTFEAAYPFGQVNLKTPQVPINVKIKAFNPLIPGDVDNSSIPIAVIDFELTNTSSKEIQFSICGSMENFIGEDGSQGKAVGNINTFREEQGMSGIFFTSDGLDKNADQWGEMTLISTSNGNKSYRTAWSAESFGPFSILDFWDDLSRDGKLENRKDEVSNKPMASLAVSDVLPPNASKTIRFLITWYFPNRTTWSTMHQFSTVPSQNYYSTKYTSAWDVALQTVPKLRYLEDKTIEFVDAFCSSEIPSDIKEAALFNSSTLRTQTCFRLSDGNFYQWEGCGDNVGYGWGSANHVWNYETATAFLFGDIAKLQRNLEFGYATNTKGLMSTRISLPLETIPEFTKAAPDGQMGCILKLYREWQLSGDDDFLIKLYPKAKSALSYAWIKGGWDANQDGVIEGVQHNTMDVRYYGPNPLVTIWYLGALRAMEEMASYLKDRDMAAKCNKLFVMGSAWTDKHLFNGEYYIQKIEVPRKEDILEEHVDGMAMADYANPDPEFQLGEGCLVDQLAGQYMAHVCGLGYLVRKENVAKTLQSILKYNYKSDRSDHFNFFRGFALGDETALLMGSFPKSRPERPFPYYTEVMTGFEYTAAVGMLYEGQSQEGLKCILNIRDRYDGRKRSPFDEAEYGHHYGRAMASWSAVLAATGFHYSGVTKEIKFGDINGTYFWSNGYSYGTVEISNEEGARLLALNVLNGKIDISKVSIEGYGSASLKKTKSIQHGVKESFEIKRLE